MRLLVALLLAPLAVLELERFLSYRRCKTCGDLYKKDRANTTDYCRLCHLEEEVKKK